MPAPKYVALFLAEGREHLGVCNRLLLEWERDLAATEPLGGLFRAMHNLKGMAATMGYGPVAELAHRAENLLDALRTGKVAVTPDLVQLLFRAVDALGSAIESAAAGGEDEDGAQTTLAAELDRAGRASERAPEAAPAQSKPAKPSRKTRAADASAAPGSVPLAAPPQFVTVVIRPSGVMRGARAALILRRVEALGAVSAVRPPAGAFEREEFDGRFSFRLRASATVEAIEAAIRSAGDVDRVTFSDVIATTDTDAAVGRQIRVDLDRLDAMMKQVGELVVARNRLVEVARGNGGEIESLAGRVARLVSDLQTEVVAARMTPVEEVFDRFPRVVRDMARELGKRIAFEIEGGEIELDRSILDELGDPLLHLIRNAADHGLEGPADRTRAGKSAEGRITLTALRERRTVAIRVTDDGRGIDRERILAKAKAIGFADAGVEMLTDDLLLRVLARPGFSTAEQVSGISGRGVGVEVALQRARALGGSLEVQSELGRGTTFTLRVPLTLAIVRALLAQAGGERYAVPLAYVAETVEFDTRAVTAIRNREALIVRERVIPTVHLRDLVAVQLGDTPSRRPTIILEVGERRTALVVDALLGQQDIVIEPFDAPRGIPPYVGGATILADGVPALILDAAALV